MHDLTAASWLQARAWPTSPHCCSVCGPTAMMASSRSSPTSPSPPSTGVSADPNCFVAPPRLYSKCFRRWAGSMHRRCSMRFGICAAYREVTALGTYPFDYLEENVQRFLLPECPQEEFEE